MQNLILILLALNAFYLVWSLVLSDKYVAPPKTMDGVPALVLLPPDKIASRSLNNHCYTLGPFNTKKTAELVSKEINNAGLLSNIRAQQTMVTLNFLVYLQAFPSKKEAESAIKKLLENEVKDYNIIKSGPYKNAISLGSFDDLDKARRHAEYIRYMGFDAKYTEQRKPKEVYWINYGELGSKGAPVTQWVNKIDPKASVQRIVSRCEF
jgi:hypothetical protein